MDHTLRKKFTAKKGGNGSSGPWKRSEVLEGDVVDDVVHLVVLGVGVGGTKTSAVVARAGGDGDAVEGLVGDGEGGEGREAGAAAEGQLDQVEAVAEEVRVGVKRGGGRGGAGAEATLVGHDLGHHVGHHVGGAVGHHAGTHGTRRRGSGGELAQEGGHGGVAGEGVSE